MAVVDELVLKLSFEDHASGNLKGAAQQVRDFGRDIDNLSTSSDSSYSQMGQATKAFRDGFNAQFGLLGTDITDMEAMMTGLGSVAASGVKAVGEAVVTSVQKYAEFEAAMAGVKRTTGLAGAEFEQLSANLRELAVVDLKGMSSAEDLAAIAEAAGMLGIQGLDNIQAFTKDVAQISVALDVSAEKAGESMARIANQFKTSLEAPRTYVNEFGQTVTENFGGAYEQVGRIGSAMNDVSQNTTATVSDIMNMTQRMSGAATTMGLTVDNVIALSGVMRDVGLGVEKGSTAMNTLMLSMIKNADAYVDAFHLNAEEFTAAVQNEPMKAIAMLSEGMGKLRDNEGPKALTLAVEDLLGKGDGITQLALKMAGSQEKLTEIAGISSEAFRENTSVINEFQVAAETQLGQWGAIQEKTNEVYRTAGEAFKPATDAAMEFADKGLNVVLDALNEIKLDAEGFGNAFGEGLGLDTLGTDVKNALDLAFTIDDSVIEEWTDHTGSVVKELGLMFAENMFGPLKAGLDKIVEVAVNTGSQIYDALMKPLASAKQAVADVVIFGSNDVKSGTKTNDGQMNISGMISSLQGLQTSNAEAFAQSENLRAAYGSLYKELAAQADKSVAPNERLQSQFQNLQYELGQIAEVGWKNSVFPDLRDQVDLSVEHVRGLEVAIGSVAQQMTALTDQLRTMQQMQNSVGASAGSAQTYVQDYQQRGKYAEELRNFEVWGSDSYGNLNPARFEAYLVKNNPELLEMYQRFGLRMPSVMHDGGPVRYHNGGMVLRRGEVPAILQTGEYVLSRQDVSAVQSGQGASVMRRVQSARYHDGGPVVNAASGGVSGGVTVNLNCPDARVLDGPAFQRFVRDIRTELSRQDKLIYGA